MEKEAGHRPRGPLARKEMTNKDTITAIVLTRNSEMHLDDCLKSIDWVDEIVIVDSQSKDKTLDIAKKYKTRIIEAKRVGFSDKRNLGAKVARCRWVLYVDADERVTPELRREIKSAVNQPSLVNSKFSAYAIPRRNIILGREMKNGGWWPDYAKRLFLKSKLKKWKGELHEEPQFEGELGQIENPLVHLKHDNLSDMVDKTNEWSEIEARLMYEADHPRMNVVRFLTAMAREFGLRMVRYQAFRDGAEGIIYALYQVYSRFVSYAKLWELQLTKSEARSTKQ